MWNRNKEHKDHIAVITSLDNYIIITLTFNTKTDQCVINSYQEIPIAHGECGPYFFINHTLFFKNIVHAVRNCARIPTLALLFQEPFIAQKPHTLIPSVMLQNYAISHPLLLQCAIIPRIHNIHIDVITSVETAYQTAIVHTKHPEDEYSFSRLLSKKNSNDFTPQEQHYNALAACGSYLMEHA